MWWNRKHVQVEYQYLQFIYLSIARYLFQPGQGGPEAFALAQAVRGPPLRTIDYTRESPMDIALFSNLDLTMEVTEGNTVSFRYSFRDFRGATAVFAGWVGFIQTQCQKFQAARGVAIATEIERYRWIYELAPLDPDRSNALWGNASSRGKVYELCESANLASRGVRGFEIWSVIRC